MIPSRGSVATMISVMIILMFGFRVTRLTRDDCQNPNCAGLNLSPLEDYDLHQDVSGECQDDECLILDVITLTPNAWTGFCLDKENVIYANWNCKKDSSLVNRTVKFQCHKKDTCNAPVKCDRKHYIEPCICEYNPLYCPPKNHTADEPTSDATVSTTTEKQTSISDPTTAKTDDPGSSESGENNQNPTTTTTTTEEPTEQNVTSACEKGPCFDEECFFGDHCYFFQDPDSFVVRPNEVGIPDNTVLFELATTDICAEAHPSALGVAVETVEENEFIKRLVHERNFEYGENRRILTSGIKRQKAPGEWRGWNLELNESVLSLETSSSSFLEYVALRENSGDVSWYYHLPMMEGTFSEYSVLCERPYEDFIVWPDRLEECTKLEKTNACSGSKHCCGIDESGTIWFGCSNLWTVKGCEEIKKDDVNERHLHPRLAMWFCDENGHFTTEYPYDPGCDCRKCVNNYGLIYYRSCYNRTGIGRCQQGAEGYSKLFCDGKETTPDFGTCCDENEIQCRDVDPLLNVWISCPSKTATKIVRCPEGSFFETAEITRRCGENGVFDTEIPNYDACDCRLGTCRGTDKYHQKWKACVGDLATGNCPKGYEGTAFWKCEVGGKFQNLQPDFSRCRPPWIDQVQNEIEAGSDSVVIMDSIDNHTKKNAEAGFEDIIRVTSLCVDLFEDQSSLEDSYDMLDKFATSYSNFLGNILTKTSVWSDFTVDNRLSYSQKIIEMTENVAFSKLNSKNEDSILRSFNKTFKDLEKSGLGFFVAYGLDPEGEVFLAQSSKIWSVEIESVHEEKGNNFAAVGLVLDRDVGVLMFPNGNETKKQVNAPIISFSIASRVESSALKLSNVTVKINFRHFHKARYPATPLIRRRLHNGEIPSEVFGSSLCYYYTLSDWNREGCSVESSTEYETICRCTHLSTISVLMDLHEYVPEPTVELVSMICSGISIVALFLTLMVFLGFESIRGERTTIGKHLCLCLLIGHIMLITVLDKKFFFLNDDACSVIAVIFHYVFMAAFFWMSIEGHHLYRLVVLVFESETNYKTRYLIVGYGFPIFIVGLTQLIATIYDERAYGQDELCWLQTPTYIWAFVGPVISITTLNLFILTMAMRLAVVAKTGNGKSNLESIKLWLKGWFSLSTLLGVTWLIGLGYIQYNYFFVYGFVVLNGLQGLFIFLFRCVLNDQVRGALARQYGNRSSQNEDSKTIQVNTTKSRSRTGNEMSGSGFVTTLSERRKSSGTSSTEILVENGLTSLKGESKNEEEKNFRMGRPLPYKQILQRIHAQRRKKPENHPQEQNPPPPYSECATSATGPFQESNSVSEYAFEENFPSDEFSGRYPPIQEEPDSFDSSEIDNAKAK